MEALMSKDECGAEVSATITLGAEEQEVVSIRGKKDGLLSDTLVELKEKCMQILGAYLQRHSVPLDEPDLDVLDETFEDEEDPLEGAAPNKKQSNS